MKDSFPWSEEKAEIIARLLVRVYEIHEVIIAETGGLPGLHDARLLHAAVTRPFATFGGKELYPSDFEKAAALFHSLIKSHPFIDGTKRTAFASALYFLEQCGYAVPEKLPMDEVIQFCVEVAEESRRLAQGEPTQPKSIAEIAAWFQNLFEESNGA
jgi:death-on-curing protein